MITLTPAQKAELVRRIDMISGTTISAEDYADAVALWNKLINPTFIDENGNPTVTWDGGPGVDADAGIPGFPAFETAVLLGGEAGNLVPLNSSNPAELAVNIMLEFFQAVEGNNPMFRYSVMPA